MNKKDEIIIKQLVIASHKAYNRGLQTGSGGNTSARLSDSDTMIVKSSGGSLGECDEVSGLVITDFEGDVKRGSEKPTREALLHGFIYKTLKEINSVVHVHAPYSIAWSEKHDFLPRVTLHSKLKICDDIPVLDIKSPIVMTEHLYLIDEIFKKSPNIPGFILRDHGIVALGNNPLEAEYNAELIEETAHIAYLKAILYGNNK